MNSAAVSIFDTDLSSLTSQPSQPSQEKTRNTVIVPVFQATANAEGAPADGLGSQSGPHDKNPQSGDSQGSTIHVAEHRAAMDEPTFDNDGIPTHILTSRGGSRGQDTPNGDSEGSNSRPAKHAAPTVEPDQPAGEKKKKRKKRKKAMPKDRGTGFEGASYPSQIYLSCPCWKCPNASVRVRILCRPPHDSRRSG